MAISLSSQYEFLLMLSHAIKLNQTLFQSFILTIHHSPKKIQKHFKQIVLNLEQGATWHYTMLTMSTFLYEPIQYGWMMLDEIQQPKEMLQSMMVILKEKIFTTTQLKKSLRYPMILIMMLIVLLIIGQWVLYPQWQVLNDMYTITLPQWVQPILNHAKSIQLVVEVGMLVLLFHLLMFYRVSKYRLFFLYWWVKIPFIHYYEFNRQIRNLSLILSFILSDDRNLSHHLNQVETSIINPIFKQKWRHMMLLIKEGNTFGNALKLAGYPKMLSSLVEMGEKQGTLDIMFRYIYEMYTLKHQKQVDQLLAYLEPFLIFLISSIVFLMAYFLYGALMSMYDSIGNLT